TLSKAKTMAERGASVTGPSARKQGFLQPLAGADRHLETALLRRIRAVVGRVEQAERIGGAVVVELAEAGGRPLEVQVAAARIGLEGVGEIAERHEEAARVVLVGLDERAERQRVSAQHEREV